MTDKNSQFMAILTNVGAAKLANANALGIPWKLTTLAVGDANGLEPIPVPTQTRLINEVRRAPLNQLKPDEKNPAVIIAEQVIPENVGGFWIREIGLYDDAGDLVAVANCPPTFKSLLAQGSGRTQIIRMNLIVSSTSNIELKIDPAVVLATREYVDKSILEVLPPNKVAGKYFQVEINVQGVVIRGWNPTKLAEFGILDGVTKDDLSKTVEKLLPKTGGTLTGNVLLTNGTEDAPEFGYITPTCEIYHDVYNQGFRIVGKYNGQNIQPFLLNFPTKSAYFFGFTAWHEGNFNPALKSDKSSTYSKDEVGYLLSSKVTGDGASVVGFASDNPAYPYMRRATDNTVYYLQPRLGFVPIQQGGGIGQNDNSIKIGWSVKGLKVTVDNTDCGEVLLTSDCDLTGAVFHFTMNAAPPGFIKANGAAVSRTAYSKLFSKIGTYYGAGDGSTTFNVPDSRAEVIRGLDDGRGVDPGRVIGSIQLDALQGHNHALFYNANVFVGSGGGNQYAQFTSSGGNNVNGLQDAVRTITSDGVNGAPRVASETRSRNVAYLACIKY